MLLRSVPKTVLFNFRYFPANIAIRFPILVSHRVILKRLGGRVSIEKGSGRPQTAMVRIGFHENTTYDQRHNYAVWNLTGNVVFRGRAHIGNGSVMFTEGKLILGDGFTMSGNSVIRCYNQIEFGKESLVADGCLIQDGDNHSIFRGGMYVNPSKPIKIGNKVWIGARCIILKGVNISDGVVVGAGSTVVKSIEQESCVVAGNPWKVIRENIKWEI